MEPAEGDVPADFFAEHCDCTASDIGLDSRSLHRNGQTENQDGEQSDCPEGYFDTSFRILKLLEPNCCRTPGV